MSKFKENDLVEVIDKELIYNSSNLNWVRPKVIAVNDETVMIELDGYHYTFNEDELILHKRDTKELLYDTVIKFMKEQDITCEETIHQTDRVIESAYDFITDLFNIVKDDLDIEEEI